MLDALVDDAETRIADLPWPLDVAVLGMGEDAHTASLFPWRATGYARAIATDARLAWVVPEQAPVPAPHARITFTLSGALLAARELLLSIAGESKLVVYRQAALARDEAMPISLVLNQTQTPVSVWIALNMNTPPAHHPRPRHAAHHRPQRRPARPVPAHRRDLGQGRHPARRHGLRQHGPHDGRDAVQRQAQRIHAEKAPHLGVVTAYNDMLSAHQPYEHYPELLRAHARSLGFSAQVAGGVPAMCDGVTQGAAGMELSLFSRDVIALGTAVALSHNVFDAALMLGVCDKIVPGLFMGALQFGHLSTVFVPAGPMTTGLSNDAKAKVRQQYAQGLVGRDALLESEAQAYHAPGTCTFYGTANSNQMLMEIMGLHLPGSSFVNPGTGLREALSKAAMDRAFANTGPHRPGCDPPGGHRDREDHRQRHRRPAGHRRFDQPHHPPDRDGARRRHPDRLGRLRRALGRDPVCWPASTPTARPT